MIYKKYKSRILIALFVAGAILVQLIFASTTVNAQTFSCPRDPDYPAAGSYQLPSGLRNECEDNGYYIFVGDSNSPSIEYHTKSSTGTDTVKATLGLQDPAADPLVWRGTATYDGHMIEIGMPRGGLTGSSSGNQAIRTDKPGTSEASSTGIRIAANDVFIAFAQAQGITLESGPGDPHGDCRARDDGTIDKNNCGIIHYTVLLTRTLSALVGIVIVVMMAVGGIQYAASRDDPSQVAGAKNHIQNTVMALIFYIFALAFLQWLVPGGVF